MQREPRDRVHEHRLAQGGPLPAAPASPEGRFHVHERQRHELGEAPRLHLQLAHPHQVTRPVHRPFHVAKHDRGRGPEAERVRLADHLQPLRGVELVRADHCADLVVENFRGSSRQRGKSCRLQLAQIVAYRHPERLGAVTHFQR